jgi:superfamily I DNA/RNA helicase
MSTWLLPRSELTSEQLRAVELSPLSHQVIFGAPGSGKTQILLHRAAFLRNHLGTKPNCFRIFVYTNVLKHYIRSALALLNLPEDAVTTYDDWCRVFYEKHIGDELPWDIRARRPDFDCIRQNVRAYIVSGAVPLPLYDFVLVDEAQDLSVDTFDTICRIARHVTICLDNKQQIYERGSSEAEILARFGLRRRNLSLLDAYRCSPFVARLAAQFIPDSQDAREYLNQVRTSQTGRQMPLLFKGATFDEERNRLVEVLRERLLIDQRIAVLFPLRRQVFEFANELRRAGIEVETQENLDFSSSRPKLITYASAKGLTFDSVLLPRLVPESFPRMSHERMQRLLFVAITRATNWVYLSTNEGNELPLLQALQPLVAERVLTIQSASATSATTPLVLPPDSKTSATTDLDFL